MELRSLSTFSLMLLLCVAYIEVHSEEDSRNNAEIQAVMTESEILGKFKTEAEAPAEPQLEIKGFVDLGWIYPNFLVAEKLRRNADHHWGVESGNAQNTVNKLEARTFTVNEVSFDFEMEYNDRFSGVANVFIYPTTRTNSVQAFSSLTRDQDIPRDAGPDGKLGTDDDIVGPDTAIDPGDGLNRVVVGVEEAYIDFLYPGKFNCRLRVGKMPSLLGIEQEVLEAPHLDTVASSTISGFSYGYPQGMQLLGFLSAVSHDDLEFGLGFTHDPNNGYNIFPGDATKNQPFALANDNLVVAGRLAFSHGTRNASTLGVSGQIGNKGKEEDKNNGGFWSFHPFLKLRLDPFAKLPLAFRIRAEGLIMDIDNRIGAHPNNSDSGTGKYDFLYTPQIEVNQELNQDGDVRHKGFYTYLYADLFHERLTLTLGYSRVESKILKSVDAALSEAELDVWGTRRTQIAARYKIYNEPISGHSIIIKAEFQRNQEDGFEEEIDNNLVTTSLVYSF